MKKIKAVSMMELMVIVILVSTVILAFASPLIRNIGAKPETNNSAALNSTYNKENVSNQQNNKQEADSSYCQYDSCCFDKKYCISCDEKYCTNCNITCNWGQLRDAIHCKCLSQDLTLSKSLDVENSKYRPIENCYQHGLMGTKETYKPISCSKNESCPLVSLYCRTCLNGYFYDNTKCVSCSATMPNCKNCTSYNSCTACDDGYYLLKGKCTKCPNDCKKCNSLGTCMDTQNQDNSNLFYNYNKSPNTNTKTQNTLFCTKNCATCQDNSTCLVCAQGYYLSKNKKTCSATISPENKCQAGYGASERGCVPCSGNKVSDGTTPCKSCNTSSCPTPWHDSCIWAGVIHPQCTSCTTKGTNYNNLKIECTNCNHSKGYYLNNQGSCSSNTIEEVVVEENTIETSQDSEENIQEF